MWDLQDENDELTPILFDESKIGKILNVFNTEDGLSFIHNLGENNICMYTIFSLAIQDIIVNIALPNINFIVTKC